MTNPKNCSLCKQGAIIDPELTQTANGQRYGVSRDTVQRHLKHLTEAPEKFYSIPEEFVTSRRKSTRTEHGWEIVNYKETTLPILELRETLDQDLNEVFARPHPERPLEGLPRVPCRVICLADFQLGKTDVKGGIEETIDRIRESRARIIADMEGMYFDEIVMPDLGDIIENFMNTSSQAQTNSAYLTKQIRYARRIFLETIYEILPYCDVLTLAFVPSNHCTVRIAPKAPASTPNDDYGIEIGHQIEDVFAGRPEAERIQILFPDGEFSEDIVYYSHAANTTFMFAHGHQRNSAIKLGEYVSDLAAYAHGIHHAVQIAVFGHYHNFMRYEWHGREIFICPSSDSGSSWFSGKNGQWARGGILVFDAVNGRSYSPNVY